MEHYFNKWNMSHSQHRADVCFADIQYPNENYATTRAATRCDYFSDQKETNTGTVQFNTRIVTPQIDSNAGSMYQLRCGENYEKWNPEMNVNWITEINDLFKMRNKINKVADTAIEIENIEKQQQRHKTSLLHKTINALTPIRNETKKRLWSVQSSRSKK